MFIDIRSIIVSALLGLTVVPAIAQIRIGQSTGITGPAAASVAEINVGARLYLDHVNSLGGVGGQVVELVTLDDKNQPDMTVANSKTLIADPKVVTLFLNRGTPHTMAVMPLLVESGIALLAPSTGAMSLHEPVNPWIFNVRTTYQAEAERLTRHLSLSGLDSLGLCYVDDSFGVDAIQGVLKVFREQRKTPVVAEAIDKSKPDYSACVRKTLSNKLLGVVMIGTSVSVSAGVKALRSAGGMSVTVGTLSNNASAGFVRELGPNGPGVIVSQVFPPERHMATPIIAEASRLAATKNIKELTPAMVEGFTAAKVLVLGLKKASVDTKGQISRAAFRQALESLNRVELGSAIRTVDLSYSKDDHTGLRYVDLSIIGSDGTFRR